MYGELRFLEAIIATWGEFAREALRLGLTEKFLAEDQPASGRDGHIRAALSHRRAAAFPHHMACSLGIAGTPC